MITIRRNAFETNSSSTHAICFDTSKFLDKVISPEELSRINKTFTYYKQDCQVSNDTINIYSSLEDKLTWLMTSMKQAGLDNPHVIDAKQLLEKIMPNSIFDFGDPEEYIYEFEDIEWLWAEHSDGEFDGRPLLNEQSLIEFLCDGMVIWGDRDLSYDGWTSAIDDIIEEHGKVLLRFGG